MFDLLTLECNENYFNSICKRGESGVYFTRMIGFDDKSLDFLKRYLISAKKKGIYINKPIGNPTENHVSNFFKESKKTFVLEKSFIFTKTVTWLNDIPAKNGSLFSDALFEQIYNISKDGTNINILENAYVKFMCWAKYIFKDVLKYIGDDIPPKVLYEGPITKYELYMLRILNRAGCDILYINFTNEDSYIKIDKDSIFSHAIYGKNHFTPKPHFSEMDSQENENKVSQEMNENFKNLKDSITLNSWLDCTCIEGIFKNNSERGALNKSHIYTLFALYMGIDKKNEYSNRILKLKNDIIESKRSFIIIDEKIQNPSIDEVKNINKITYLNKKELSYNLACQINITTDKVINTFIKSAFIYAIEKNMENTLPKLYNTAMRFLCWINRYLPKLFENFSYNNIPILVYYGNCAENEAEFLYMFSYIPIDVLFISPSKENIDIFKAIDIEKRLIIEELPTNSDVFPFPEKDVKVNFETVAYNAERQLDSMLYEGTGLFRNRQFTRSNPITLKTTYEEIDILWRLEAKYRSGFEENKECVSVPNIFAKISGIKNRDCSEYFNKIEKMITSKTIFIKNIPYISSSIENPLKANVNKFIKYGKILPDVIKNHKEYRFDYLKEDTQDYILEKLQKILDLKWIKCDSLNTTTIISTILNIDKNALRLLSEFNFTGEIPKIIVIDVDERMMSLEDCIYLLFLNFVGFDIAVFTPTGYRNIEKYINAEAFQEHQAGEYMFNLRVPILKCKGSQTSASERNFIDRLFGRRN